MSYIYTLQLADGKYYVGKSSDPDNRYLQHKSGSGCAWTKKYPPVKLLDTKLITSEHDETNTTKDLMKKYGVDNVRGGAYVSINLDEATVSVLEREIRGNSDSCFKCGGTDHWASKCKAEDEEEVIWCCSFCPKEFKTYNLAKRHETGCSKQTTGCHRCGRSNHRADACYAKTHANGQSLVEEDDDDDDDDYDEDDNDYRSRVSCYKCGCRGHYANECASGMRSSGWR